MDQVKAILAQKTAILDGYGDRIPPVKNLAKSVGVNTGTILAGFLFVLCVIFLLFEGFAIVVTIGCVVYPGLLSIRAIESPEADDDKVWLTYWMVYGTLHVAETFVPFIFYLIPYWGLLRPALFLWMIQFGGAEWIHRTVVQSLLQQHRSTVISFLNKFQNASSKIASDASAEAKKQISDPKNIAKVAQAAATAQEVISEATNSSKYD